MSLGDKRVHRPFRSLLELIIQARESCRWFASPRPMPLPGERSMSAEWTVTKGADRRGLHTRSRTILTIHAWRRCHIRDSDTFHGLSIKGSRASVTLVNSVKLGTFQVQKSKIAQKDGSEMIRCWLPGLSPRAMRRGRSSRGTTSPARLGAVASGALRF